MLKKLVLGGVVLVFVVIAAALWVTLSYIDRIARVGVERAATSSMGVSTTLGGMKIAVFAGECGMDDLTIANPSGYNTPHFFHMDRGEMSVKLGTLRQDLVVIPRLELTGLTIHLEKQAGKSNYEVILENLRQSQSQSPSPDEKADGRKYTIERLVIRDTVVHAQLFDVVPMPVIIPEIVLTDVGSDSDRGLLLDQLTGTIVEAVMVSIVRFGGDKLPAEIVGPLSDSLQSLAGIGEGGFQIIQGFGQLGDDPEAAVRGILDGVGRSLESAGQTGEGLGRTGDGALRSTDVGEKVSDTGGEVIDTTKEVVREAEGVLRGIGNVLGGKKEEESESDE